MICKLMRINAHGNNGAASSASAPDNGVLPMLVMENYPSETKLFIKFKALFSLLHSLMQMEAAARRHYNTVPH